MTMLKARTIFAIAIVACVAASAVATSGARAAGEPHETERNHWTFGGMFGHYDKDQLQRGFQVYREVCSSCHSISRIAFRNLVQPGGPEFPEDAVKALAAEYEVKQPPDGEGEVKNGPAKLSDTFPPLYANTNAARAIHNGALPPDLSVIAKARGVHYTGPWYLHPWAMLKDIASSYQEGGADYLVALMTGYKEKSPIELSEGMNYNAAFPGNQIAMINPFASHTKDEPQVTYQDGTPQTVEQYAKDVAAFLSWASDPSLNERKQLGWLVMLYLLITTGLLYVAKRRIWSNVAH